MTSDQAQQFSALPWVRSLVEDALREARRILEDHAEGIGSDEDMAQCVAQLHQVNGALLVAQSYGAAMLADEMEQVARGLVDGSIGRKEEAAEVLMLGMVQLPAYLERVEAGEPDIPLILMPLLNDLRAARDAPLVSEISLFAPKLDQLIASEEVDVGSGNPELADVIRRRRVDYHKAQLAWYRGVNVDGALRDLRDLLSSVSNQAGTARVRRMLDAADALLVAIAEDTVEPSIAVKLLFGRLDRYLKQIIDEGEEAAARGFPAELLKNLLYYVARSNSDNPVIEAVRQSADLANSFPVSEADLAVTGDSTLMGPGKELFAAVADALHHDLTGIKDELDLYIRGNRADTARLVALTAPLQKVADTLGMVGRGDLRTPLKAHSDQLRDLAPDAIPDDNLLMSMASDILWVESALSGLTPPRAQQDEESGFAESMSVLSDAEMLRHQSSAIEEAVVELSRVKDAVSLYLKNPVNPEPLGDVPARLHGVSGVLRILQQADAADQLDRLGGYLQAVSDGEAEAPDHAQRETLADVLTGVEYYLEAVLEDRPNKQDILDFARTAAERLGPQAATVPAAGEEPVAEATPAAEKPALEDIDAEILEIFIEEAREELDNISVQYPRWKGEQDDKQALQTMRRSFHTLKGSGRLVGAKTIGEFAWAIENLLNRVIDNRIKPNADLFALLDEATAALPLLVEAQEQGIPPSVDVVPLEHRAFAMAEGRAEPAAAPEVAVAEPEAPVAATQEAEVEAATAEESVAPPAEPEISEIQIEGEPIVLDESALATVDLSSLEEEDVVKQQLPGELTPEEMELLAADSEEIVLEAPPEPMEEVLPPSTPETEQPAAEELVLEEAAVAEAAETAPAIPADAPLQLDPVLLEIFRNESASHLDGIDHFIAEAKDKPAGSTFDEDLRRALHTLRGSAHMAEVEPVAELAGRLENWVNLLNQRGLRTDSASLALLQRGRDCLQGLVDAINVGGITLPDWQAVVDETEQRIDELEGSAESQFVESVDVPSVELETEVLEIFSEEARELMERVEDEFNSWRANPGDSKPVAELQRILHTLKGGARLAGVATVGDLTHALESLFETVAAGFVNTTPGLLRLVRAALDQASNAVEQLNLGLVPEAQSQLIERLESAARGDWLEEPSTLLQSEMRVFDMDSAASPTSAEPTEAAGAEAPAELPEEVAAAEEPGSELVELVGEDELEELVSSAELEEELSSDLVPEVDDSTLLTDSQLLTDSELLSESQLSQESAAAPTADQARIIPFPGGEKRDTGAEQPVERIPLPGPEPEEAQAPQERIRVGADILDQMVNNAGEVSIYRARMEQQNTLFGFNLQELNATITRLREQLRQLDLETEAQILSRYEREHEGEREADFDPLEMDQYSTIQQLSRALVETVTDLSSIGDVLDDLNRDTDTLLLQQSRVTNDLQDSLLRTRMMPFANRVPRLQRVVRQAADDLGKVAELEVVGASGEMDRTILDRMMGPLEHMLRNAVAHGIEELAERTAIGKTEAGRITLSLYRDGADVVLEVQDDGAGMDRDAIRERAIERGLLDPDADISADDLLQYVLLPGFTTADEVSQVAGRGVGMDVVLSEIKQLGGSLDIHSEQGAGTRFTVRLPFTLAIAQTLLVTAGEDIFAVPHTNVDALVRVARQDLEDAYAGRRPDIEYGGHSYAVRYLGSILGNATLSIGEEQRWLPVLLVRSGEHRVAVHVDGLLGNRQIVVKSLGAQLSTVRWFTGGTILADGRVALILDMTALARLDVVQHVAPEAAEPVEEQEAPGVTVMVVDDSITVRKVTSRLLERHNMHVITAKDGVDAVTMLQEHRPDLMLLDIEMPRMDGFELARHMQNTAGLSDIPIIMITSRTGEKHRNRALELGVRSYLGKPYQESELLDNIYTLLAESGE
jgi:chemosensory pili system protein ChpA (sensor histidine kinase/response regulator)